MKKTKVTPPKFAFLQNRMLSRHSLARSGQNKSIYNWAGPVRFAGCPWLNWTRRQTVCALEGTVQIDSRLALIAWLALMTWLALITCSQLEKDSAAKNAWHGNRGELGSFLAASLQYF
jgi:hypothetical protein